MQMESKTKSFWRAVCWMPLAWLASFTMDGYLYPDETIRQLAWGAFIWLPVNFFVWYFGWRFGMKLAYIWVNGRKLRAVEKANKERWGNIREFDKQLKGDYRG